MNIAIVVAAGRGRRIREKKEKQYLLLQKKPLLFYCLDVLQRTKVIDEVILVANKDQINFCQEELVARYKLTKVKKIVKGGRRRQDSVLNGTKALPLATEIVLIHDGVRPFITPKLIENAVQELKGCDGVVLGLPVVETVKQADKTKKVIKTLKRNVLYSVQTPQVFKKEALVEAYRKAKKDKFYGTDDASLLERAGFKVKIVEGSDENIKITTSLDLVVAEAILNKRAKGESGA